MRLTQSLVLFVLRLSGKYNNVIGIMLRVTIKH